MAETRSKSKTKGDNDGFNCALSKNYKRRQSDNENDKKTTMRSLKKFKNPKNAVNGGDVTAQSIPSPVSATQSEADNDAVTEEMAVEWEEDPFCIDCSDEEHGSHITKCKDEIIAVDNLNETEEITETVESGPLLLAEDVSTYKQPPTECPENNDIIDDDNKINCKSGNSQNSSTVETKGISQHNNENNRVSLDEVKVNFESDMASQNSAVFIGPADPNGTASACDPCPYRDSRNYRSLIKISEELKTVNTLVEKIKGELEKYMK